MTRSSPPRVVVIGAGLAGISTALELAERGIPSVLLERDPVAMNRASLRNEGKIHLGLIYAADPTLETARLQLQGALLFHRLLRRWLGRVMDELPISTPFVYCVPHDSVLTPDELEAHYERLQALYGEILGDGDYLGGRPDRLYERTRSEVPPLDPTSFQAIFRTEERAVETEWLARTLRAAIDASPLIEFRPGFLVAAVSPRQGGYRVEGSWNGVPAILDADQVVNACWENRPAIDAGVGIRPADGWLCRLKYRVVARLPEELRGAPSMTMVLGRYGDVVVRPDGTAYLSWYPAALAGWSEDSTIPGEWDAACRGEVPREIADRFAERFMDGLEPWYPGIRRCRPFLVDAGAIVAYGRTDVDDPASGLHHRSRIGVTSVEGYHSLDPGKLTTAPMYGAVAAERVAGLAATPPGASPLAAIPR
jgi:glycine/D-amino acid oxidase-like deaminating enzyme